MPEAVCEMSFALSASEGLCSVQQCCRGLRGAQGGMYQKPLRLGSNPLFGGGMSVRIGEGGGSIISYDGQLE
jgi:hypothetical protein